MGYSRPVLTASTALLVVLLGAEPAGVAPDRAAAIALDQKAAQEEVAKKYGGKKPSELSNAERAQMVRDQAAAEQKVLDKHGVDAKTWARQQMAQSPQQAAAQKQREEQLAEKRKAEAEAAAKPAEKEITVQRGFSDANPVTLEEQATDGVAVEQGLPPDVAAEQAEASGFGADFAPPPDAAGKAAPSGKSKGKGGKGSRRR